MNRMPAGRQSIEQSSQQNGACSVNTPHGGQIELHDATAIQCPFCVRDFLGCGRCVREIEWTGGRQTHEVALAIRPNDDGRGVNCAHDTFPVQRHERR